MDDEEVKRRLDDFNRRLEKLEQTGGAADQLAAVTLAVMPEEMRDPVTAAAYQKKMTVILMSILCGGMVVVGICILWVTRQT